ncbi:unnamed protein product [Phytomonas sp. EM1]|nr:unnamed protein product [Phytomonas sp. EM1]|eukprot:CCW60811.1 unnamed protein product [Phytomonas sp. isolate EM1]
MSIPEIKLASPQVQEGLMHPCEFIQRTSLRQEECMRMNRIRTTHGLGAAIDVGLTEATLLGSHRLGSLLSSNTLYNVYRGNLTQINPSDIYGLPENDPNVQPSSRTIVERGVYGYELTMKNLGV